jgi:hypothetical protein
MTPTQLFGQLAVCAVALVALNAGVASMSRDAPPRRLVREIDGSPPVTDLFVGHSLMEAGADVAAFESARPGSRGLNVALGSTQAVEHDLLMRRAMWLKPARVYYGFSDTQLTDPLTGGWGDLIVNRAMSYYVDRETAIGFYAPDDPAAAWQIRVVSWIPILVERSALWARVERLRRQLAGIGMPARGKTRFGRAEDFAQLEARYEADFAGRCRAAVGRKAELIPPVKDMLEQARENGAKMQVVEMPITSGHRRRFYETPEWAAYREHLAGLIRRAGGEYVVASDWVGDDGFDDVLHLNDRGAAEFSRRLAAVSEPRK